MKRKRLVHDWSRHATLLKGIADLFSGAGSDAGAMHVHVEGLDHHAAYVERTWQLVATHGDGPFVPTLAAAAIIRKIQARALAPGAFPCVGLLALSEVTQEMAGLAIRTETTP